MSTFRLLCLGLAVSVVVLITGVFAAYLQIKDSFQIIAAALCAQAALIAAIERKVRATARSSKR